MPLGLVHPLLSSVPKMAYCPIFPAIYLTPDLLAPDLLKKASDEVHKSPVPYEKDHSPTLSRSENNAAQASTSYHPILRWGFTAVEDGTSWLWYCHCVLLPSMMEHICHLQQPVCEWFQPLIVFLYCFINQTSITVSSETLTKHSPQSLKHKDFMLNLSVWQKETGNTAGSPSNSDQNHPSRKIQSPTSQCERMTGRWGKLTQHYGNSWSYSKQAPQVSHWTKYLCLHKIQRLFARANSYSEHS